MEAYDLYYCTIRTANLGPIAQRATWYLDLLPMIHLSKYTKLQAQAIIRMPNLLRPESLFSFYGTYICVSYTIRTHRVICHMFHVR